MTTDDELRARLRDAADAIGSQADPAAAATRLAAATSATPNGLAAILKVLGIAATAGLTLGSVLGATVWRNGDDVAASAAGVDVGRTATFDCPNGAVEGSLRAGDRVFVVGRDADASWSAIRRPDRIDTVVWVRADALTPDAAPTDVPVLDCPDVDLVFADAGTTPTTIGSTTLPPDTTVPADTTTPATPSTTTAPDTTAPATSAPRPATTVPPPPPPTPTPTPPPTAPPTVPPTPPPPTDSQAPTIQSSTSSTRIAVSGSNCPTYTSTATLSAFTADDVGVTSVSATWGPTPSGSATLTRTSGTAQNGTWQTTIGPFTGLPPEFAQFVTVTLTASDAAGNARSANLQIYVVGTNCDFG